MACNSFIYEKADASLPVVMLCDFKMLRDGIVGCVNERVPPWLLDSQHIVVCNLLVSQQCGHDFVPRFHYIVLQY